jgi:sugar phosphate isomerase/epimerase
MRIGLLRRYNPSLPAYLARLGFRSAEVEFRVGDAFDPTTETQAKMDAALAEFRARDIEIAALASYGNLLDPNSQAAHECKRWLVAVMEAAARNNIPVVGVMAGRDPALPALANLPRFVDVFGPLVEQAESLGVRLAIENCPKFHAFPFRSTNFAFSMEAYDAIFAALPISAWNMTRPTRS